MEHPRKPNMFENILLIIGILIIIVGYAFVQKRVLIEGFTTAVLQTVFLWLMLSALVIIVSVTENMKEELKDVVNNQLKEIRFLRAEVKNLKKRK